MKVNTKREINRDTKLTELQKEILACLVYFNIFKFPLKQSEIQNLLKNHFSEELIGSALQKLTDRKIIYNYDGFYSSQKGVKHLVETRINNQRFTGQFFSKVPFFVRLISRFPYVRSVAISGSLSKGVLHENGDIDYFIITKSGRLWLARTLLILFKKTVLLNSKDYFCVNYFISENNLTLEDRNRFTATEISFLLPVYNPQLIQDFKHANNWLHGYYGHFEHPIKLAPQTRDWPVFKRFIELCLNNRLGDSLDRLLMQITLRKWSLKFSHFDSKKFELTMRSRSDISKHHPQDFQTKVLTKFEEDYNAIIGE